MPFIPDNQEQSKETKIFVDPEFFAYSVAHELKQPLCAIISLTSLYNQYHAEIPAEELLDTFRTVENIARRMDGVLDELLLLSGMIERRVELEQLSMANIVNRAWQQLQDIAEIHEAKISMPEQWPTALGHGPWVERIWVNYLNNAIKYGGQPPHITIGAAKQLDGMVRFWVRDNGPGLTQAEQARLFRPFTQLNKKQTKGYGLGLAIVQCIVERLRGKVGVESEGNQGCTFFFTLPAKEYAGLKYAPKFGEDRQDV